MGVYSYYDEYLEELPTQAMLINGHAIEHQLAGYRTLMSDGRGLVAPKITSTSVPKHDGKIYQSSNYQERQIKVKFALTANTSRDFREKLDRLNQLLSQPEQEISFNDQPEFAYNATLSDITEEQKGWHTMVGTITLTASNPYKHRVLPVENKGVGSIQIMEPIFYAVNPEKIVVTVEKAVADIKISNGRQTISISGNITAGELVIKPTGGDDFLTINGVAKPELLDWMSDLENFEIKSLDTVTVTPSLPINVVIRSKRL